MGSDHLISGSDLVLACVCDGVVSPNPNFLFRLRGLLLIKAPIESSGAGRRGFGVDVCDGSGLGIEGVVGFDARSEGVEGGAIGRARVKGCNLRKEGVEGSILGSDSGSDCDGSGSGSISAREMYRLLINWNGVATG